MSDITRLLDLLLQTGAEAYLHQGCGCEWGSRGERMWHPSCTVDALLGRLRAANPEPTPHVCDCHP